MRTCKALQGLIRDLYYCGCGACATAACFHSLSLSLSVGFSMVQLFQCPKHMQQPLTQEHVCTQCLVACILFHVFYFSTAVVAGMQDRVNTCK